MAKQYTWTNADGLTLGGGRNSPDSDRGEVSTKVDLTETEVASVQALVSADGIATSASNLTAAVGSAGALTGAYYYTQTFATSLGETAPWPGTATVVNPSSQQVNLTAIPLGPAGTIARRIYRTPAVSGVVDPKDYRFVAEISDNTTTTYTDNLADGSLGAAVNWSATNRGQFKEADGTRFANFSDQSVSLGQGTFSTNTGYASVAIGYEALKDNTSGRRNIALGIYALTNLTTGYQNVALGVHAGQFVEEGASNVFVGQNAGFYGNDGSAACNNNVAVGFGAFSGGVGVGLGSNNTALGYYALQNISAANSCLALGFSAGRYADNVRQIFLDVVDRSTNTGSKDSGWMYGEADSTAINQRTRMNSLVRVGPPSITVATLPAASATLAGYRGYVTDANATTFWTVAAGGGANTVPVFCDGAAWRIA